MMNTLLSWLKRPSQRALGVLLGAGFLAGFVFFVVFHFTMSATNSMDICISCHEMEGVYQEYTKSVHFRNRSGVRATCADCHVPHGKTFGDWVSKFLVKLEVGSKDIFHHLVGTYPDAAAFEKKRWDLAQNVIADMKKRGSKECRACHMYTAMDFDSQAKSAAKRHQRTAESGDKSCIDCHTGIAHTMPEDPADVAAKAKEEAEKAAKAKEAKPAP
ncbi:MAG: NapC/NirT family cytochrome c [Magnetococcales bacterium]|nr:NapC/NirT family cytochrome c [Magnetococcales bacterium]